jgi:uncharacterized oxidoreductase
MDLQNNTILITGGSSGIGLEMTRQFSNKKNNILICGRTLSKLKQAKEEIPSLHFLQCDISKPGECVKLKNWVVSEHPGCNILINNAAIVTRQNFYEDVEAIQQAESEIATNLMAPIRLSKLLYPVLERNKQPEIINITTGLAFVPRTTYPFYCATKSALHSFTKVLRSQSDRRNINISEVMFPAVDTPWHEGNPPKIAISPKEAVSEMITQLEKGKAEIHVGKVKLLNLLSRIAPGIAFKMINRIDNHSA